METRKNVARLNYLSDTDFSSEVSKRTNYVFGKCSLTSKRSVYPVNMQIAHKFYSHRMVLIAEAAHVMPPIGAQGLNTSLEDIIVLKDLLIEASANDFDIGTESMLKKYNSQRLKTVIPRLTGINLLNRVSESDFQPVKDLRMAALKWLDNNKAARQILIKAGLGKGFL